jgi:hypothetical protein
VALCLSLFSPLFATRRPGVSIPSRPPIFSHKTIEAHAGSTYALLKSKTLGVSVSVWVWVCVPRKLSSLFHKNAIAWKLGWYSTPMIIKLAPFSEPAVVDNDSLLGSRSRHSYAIKRVSHACRARVRLPLQNRLRNREFPVYAGPTLLEWNT